MRIVDRRFSLATLVAWVFIAAVFCGGVAWHMKTVAALRNELVAARQQALVTREQEHKARAVAEQARHEAELRLRQLQAQLEPDKGQP